MSVSLGRFGTLASLWRVGEAGMPAGARHVEALGYGTFWVGGNPRLPQLRPILEATERITVATGVLNVWHYNDDPALLAREHAELTRDFPGRVMVGIGIGHPERQAQYTKPLSTMRSFLDRLDAASTPVPRDERCLAALRPKMLQLAGERSLGTHPAWTPFEHTRWARERLGAEALIAPLVHCVLDTDIQRARASAREFTKRYFDRFNYGGNLRLFGFQDDDLADGGSDEVLAATVPMGSPDDIAEYVRGHLDAGADHVSLRPIGVAGFPLEQWSALASALIGPPGSMNAA